MTAKPTTEQMIAKFQELQKKITLFEKNYDSKYNHLEKRQRINQILDNKVDELILLQDSKITVDLGGEEIETSTLLVKNCKFENVLSDKLGEDKVFLDYPVDYFKRVLFLMRNKPKESDGRRTKIAISSKMNVDIMNETIKSFFKGNEAVLKEVRIEREDTSNKSNTLFQEYVQPVIVPVNNYNYNNYNYNNNANYNGYD